MAARGPSGIAEATGDVSPRGRKAWGAPFGANGCDGEGVGLGLVLGPVGGTLDFMDGPVGTSKAACGVGDLSLEVSVILALAIAAGVGIERRGCGGSLALTSIGRGRLGSLKSAAGLSGMRSAFGPVGGRVSSAFGADGGILGAIGADEDASCPGFSSVGWILRMGAAGAIGATGLADMEPKAGT